MSFNIIFTFRVNCRNSLWNLVVIFNFRGGSTFNFRPILHSFPTELKNLHRTKTILRERVPFYQEKEAIFEVILSTCSEFSQIGTPHFSLEGVLDLPARRCRRFMGMKIGLIQKIYCSATDVFEVGRHSERNRRVNQKVCEWVMRTN